MVNFSNLSERIDKSFSKAERMTDSASYQQIGVIFSNAEAQVREYIQDITKEEIKRIFGKLKSGREITPEELKFIKLWIVGDAEYYVKLENNFNDWLLELKRIIGEINKMKDLEPNVENASHLKALLEDGKRVIFDIAFFLEKKERIRNFEEATLEIDREERDLLIKLLKGKLVSGEF